MPFPVLGEAIPRRGNRFSRRIWQWLLLSAGWDLEGTLPNRAKFVIIGAPHTSNWDFCVAMAALHGLGLDARWIGKHTLFRWPIGGIMRLLGGMPVVRTERRGVVQSVVQTFDAADRLVIAITPEGTRKRVERWKTGFYHIAVQADVPIIPAYLDYPRKRMGFGPPMLPSGDAIADVTALRAFYEPYARTGRNPENY